MVKREKLSILAKTETGKPAVELPLDPVRARGVGLRLSEWKRITEIAGELGMNTHELSVWALRYFIRQYAAGEIETETKKTLPGF